MKPLNSKDRKKAFIQFLLLFIVTVGVLVLALYFDVKAPIKENTYLKDKVRYFEGQLAEERKFVKEMSKIKSLLDSMDMPGVSSQYMEQLVSSKVAALQTSIPESDSSYRHDMYTNVIQTYLELKNSKSKLYDLSDVKSKLEEYTDIIDEYRKELDQAKRDLDICRQLNSR